MTENSDKNLEIEVKFFIADIAAVRDKLISEGATSQGRIFETNIRYDDPNESLLKKKSLLRLRKDRQVRLTVKTDPAEQSKEFKILRELEVTVNDFDVMDMILNSLGFHKAQIYEKWRESFIFNQVELCLDTLPYGTFLEIEGSPNAIRTAADLLGLNWNLRILSNYLEIFEHLKQAERLEFTDVTFENFKINPVQFKHYRSRFEVQTE